MKAMLAELCRRAAAEGRDTLLEVELYDLLAAGGIAVPQRFLLGPEPGRWEAELGQLDGEGGCRRDRLSGRAQGRLPRDHP